MPKKFSQRAEDLRRALAQEAARIMAEHGIEDFLQAKRKAADRLGVNDVSVLPKNIEIEAALREHQRLFGRDSHDHTLKEQRRIALDTMRLLEEFQPRLVGSVLTGTATNYSDINLHLFADRSESVAIKLLEIGIPHEFYERRVKMDAERSVNYPALRFEANGRTVDATVFPIDGIRQSPYSPVDGRPMKRALPHGQRVGRTLRPHAVVRQYRRRWPQDGLPREHQRLAALLIEFDGDEGILEIAQHLDQMLEALDADAVHRIHHRARGIGIAVGDLVREERRGHDHEFLQLGAGFVERARHQGTLHQSQHAHEAGIAFEVRHQLPRRR
jgi:hypothetical protein